MLLALSTAPALAHVVFQRQSLRQWAQQADVIVVADILSGLAVWSAPDGSEHQEYFKARVVQSLTETQLPETLDVFPHAEGEPRFKTGDRALLFLDRTGSRAEFAHMAHRFPYFTTQGAGDEWIVDAGDADITAIAVRWRTLGRNRTYKAQRDLLLLQLDSSIRRLHVEAISDFLKLKHQLQRDREAIERLTAMSRSSRLGVGERVGLIGLLSGVPEYAAGAELFRLAGEVSETRDRALVIRAAGRLRDDSTTTWLRDRLHESDPAIQDAALFALGHPWHSAAVPDVAAVAVSPAASLRVGTAAVRALGRIATPEARAALQTVAVSIDGPRATIAQRELDRLNAQ